MKVKLAVAIVLAAFLLIFALQNFQVVELRFLVWKLEMSRALMILGVFGGGVAVGSLVSNIRRIRGE